MSEHIGENPTSPKWFAGALEAGGGLYLTIRKTRKRHNVYTYSCPEVAFHEPKEEFVDALQAEYGGYKMRHGNSWSWRKAGYEVAELMAEAGPYVVSRTEMVTALENWLQADTSERVQIAEQMKGYDRFGDGSVEDYAELVRHPEFVAGVIDNRGSITNVNNQENGEPSLLAITTQNKPLLEAIKRQFNLGRQVRVVSEAGRITKFAGQEVTIKKTSWGLRFSEGSAKKVEEFTQPYLKIPLFK